MAASRYWPLWELTISRMRIFYREPAAVFWVYGFPLVMALSLGTAFRENPKEDIRVDLVEDTSVQVVSKDPLARIGEILRHYSSFRVNANSEENWQKRLQSGKTDLVIEVFGAGPS